MRFALIMQHANMAYCVQRAFYVREKHSITRGLGEKILTQTHEITHTMVKVKWPAPNYM